MTEYVIVTAGEAGLPGPAGAQGPPGNPGGVTDQHGDLQGLGDNDHPQYLLVVDIDDVPVDGVVNAPISSNWAFDHLAAADPHPVYTTAAELATAIAAIDHGALAGLGDNDHPQYLLITNIDDVPVNGEITAPISSNWAFDHLAAADPHPGYLTPAEGNAAYDALGAAAAAVAAHEAAVDPHPQYTTTAEAVTVAAAAITVHEAAVDPHPTYTTAAELAAYAQPLDADLTALAGLATTAGNIIYANGSTWATLPIGTASEVLTVTAGLPAWETSASGVTDHGALTGLADDDHPQYVLRSILTTDGDLFTRAGGVISRIGVGTNTQVLTVVAGAPAWAASASGVTDHGALTGLADNDHPQYLLVADIDDVPVNGELAAPISSNWAFDHLAAADPHPGYTTAAELAAAITAHEAAVDPHPTYTTAAELAAAIAAIDHGALLGLADDDHTQYALLAGRAGGQVLVGGTAAGDDLTLRATADTVDGDIIFQVDPTTEIARFTGGVSFPLTYLQGSALPQVVDSNTPAHQVVGGGSGPAWSLNGQFSSDNLGAFNIFSKSRGASPGTHGAVQNNDYLGGFLAYGSFGGAYIQSAVFAVRVDGTPTSGVPARLEFSLGDGTGSVVQRLAVNSTGAVGLSSSFGTAGQVATSAGTAAPAAWVTPPWNTFDIQITTATGFNGDITVLQHAGFAFTVNQAWYQTDSGTISANVKIEGTSITGLSALALTSTEANSTASAANTVAAGNTVKVTLTSNATAVNASITLHCTRT